MTKNLIAIIILFAISAYTQISANDSVNVKVAITGFKSDKGLCRLLVYDNEKGFPEDPDLAVLISSSEIKNKRTDFSFVISSGTYAISILHDENSNEKLDKTWYGKPKEGFGISNNPRTKFGPPSFEESSVIVDHENVELLIKMLYL
ncbi:MAG: DUF2141 domain-containing protein [Candidatus Delongbacteria bacterium]|nr:DUF2141 domain-containing protein [Candidatus Delongbacteria bacterium]